MAVLLADKTAGKWADLSVALMAEMKVVMKVA
jgi:hypothetical protein